MCHVVPVCGDNGTSVYSGVCCVRGAGAYWRRGQDTGATICCNCKVVTYTSLCSAPCARTRVKISPQHSARLMARMGYIIQSVYTKENKEEEAEAMEDY